VCLPLNKFLVSILKNKNIVVIFSKYLFTMKVVFVTNKHKFVLFAFPFISVRFSVLNEQSAQYELLVPQEKLMENWVWNIQWSPFRVKQVRLLENEIPRPEFTIQFQEKLPLKPTGLAKVALNNLSIKGIDIERKPSKLNLSSCELKKTNPFDLSQLNPQ
jgi:hypothetical protein